ncbi:MAG: FtsX-like permease family protein, partial [Clostridia bacterium]|nr:FtsX-like permease family protein [Clostridia bacterium]
SFFVGMKSASPDMKKTANSYFVKNNLMDLQIFSSIGFTSEEIKKVSAVDGVHSAVGVKSVDTIVFSGENGIINASNGAAMACHVMSMDFKKAQKFAETGEADDTYINRVNLVEGRFPQKKNECVVDYYVAQNYPQLAVGSVITLSGDGTTLDDSLNTVDFKIVGAVSSPIYVSFERGTTDIASGTIGMFIYIDGKCFIGKNYTSAYVTIDNKEDYDVYSSEYTAAIKAVGKKIESISQPIITSRISDVKKEYKNKIKDGEESFKKLKAETTKELKVALKDIDDIQNYIDTGDEKINKARQSLADKVEAAEAQLEASKKQYDYNKTVYELDKADARDKGNQLDGSEKAKQIYNDYYNKQKADRKEIDKLRENYSALLEKCNTAKSEADKAESAYQSAVSAVTAAENELKSAQAELEKFNKQQAEWTEESGTSLELIKANVRSATAKCNRVERSINEAKSNRDAADEARNTAKEKYNGLVEERKKLEATIESREANYEKNLQVLMGYAEDIDRIKKGEQALTIFKGQLEQSASALLASKIAITESQLRVYYEKSKGGQELTAREADLKSAKTRLETAEKNYSAVEHDVKIKIGKVQGDIEKNQLFLNELNESKWSVLYQTELPGHESYGQSLENINAIANVFPVFFFVIAAFMCLATMTRMVQEERMLLGTLKALGFGSAKILFKYYAYASIACLSGSIIGSFAGTMIFPRAIDKAYGMMYEFPQVNVTPDWFYIILGTVFSFAVTIIATAAACRSELKVQAAQLMRPKAPPPGKRVFIERFTTFWNTLSFGAVVTARNMFRNKRRMIMTIVGVACCTTLILSAFGLSNSVDKIISAQYGEDGITEYDLAVTLDEEQIPNESETLEAMKEDIRVKDAMLFITKTMTASSGKRDTLPVTAHIMIPEKPNNISDFFKLRTRGAKKELLLTDNGAVISEKLAKDTGVQAGGALSLESNSGEVHTVTVSAITENYLDHYIYISPNYYKKIFDEKPQYKNILLNLESFTASGDEQNLADDILAYNDVTGVSSTDVMIRSFNGVIDRLDVVIIIFIVSAGLLALIILYNLTNISVQERLREIATVKVLGFTDGEVTAYVYRENIFLTIAGILSGVLGGTILHKAIIDIAEVNIAMFGRDIYWWSYVLAVVITAIFSAAVCFFVHRRLKSMDTVSALKSVE